jgi:hypothetical protein
LQQSRAVFGGIGKLTDAVIGPKLDPIVEAPLNNQRLI